MLYSVDVYMAYSPGTFLFAVQMLLWPKGPWDYKDGDMLKGETSVVLLSDGGYIHYALVVVENVHQVGKLRIESDH